MKKVQRKHAGTSLQATFNVRTF